MQGQFISVHDLTYLVVVHRYATLCLCFMHIVCTKVRFKVMALDSQNGICEIEREEDHPRKRDTVPFSVLLKYLRRPIVGGQRGWREVRL